MKSVNIFSSLANLSTSSGPLLILNNFPAIGYLTVDLVWCIALHCKTAASAASIEGNPNSFLIDYTLVG